MNNKRMWTVLLLFTLVATGCLSRPGALREAAPEDVGMDSNRLGRLNAVVNTAISRGDFPGAVLLVARKGHVVFRRAYGFRQWIPSRHPMRVDDIFDMASVTKPVATAASIMVLLEQGRLRLWDPVTDYVPNFKPFVKEEEGEKIEIGDARLWHLLTHTSGLPPYTNAEDVKAVYGKPCPTESLVHYIAGLDKISAPGEEFHYSCLGFITLAHIIQRITGYGVDQFAQKYIFHPLGMTDTFYSPGKDILSRCVPTEIQGRIPSVGVVHDPLAMLQGGVSGNAGLFSTADDLCRFSQMMLNGGVLDGIRIFSPLTVERMTEIFGRTAFAGRGLGWDLDSDYSTNGGDIFGADSFGHSGYTGTSIWMDPETETILIFLTNRVHPVDGGAVLSTRSKVANVVAASILDP